MKDRRAITRALRRLSSTRAAAFLEFCMIAPILVMFCSGIFEFVQLWDAKIMANHAAWTVGRIASVRAGASTSPDAVPVTRGMKFATAALMSTATMGIGGDAGKPSRGWLNGPLQGDIQRLSEGLHLSGADGRMTAALEDFPTRYLEELFGKLGSLIYLLFSGPVAMIVDDSINDVRVWWEAALRQQPAAKMSEILHACHTHGVEDGDRQLRQMGVAQRLVERTVGGRPVVSVTEGQTSPFILSKAHGLMGDTSLAFPRCLDATSAFEGWRVKRDSGWPPSGAAQRMILVAVSWPFERAWLYPIFSREKWSGNDPVAVGESIAYPQPKICNANLRSVGAEAYASDPAPKIPQEFGDLKERYVNFLKTAAFAITYRLGHEFIGAHDAYDKLSHSHKGLGLMCVKPSQRTEIEKRFGNHRSPWIWDVGEKDTPTEESSKARDGLCYWMDRAKLPPPQEGDPWNLKAESDKVWNAWKARDTHYWDYLWSWRNVAVVPSGNGTDNDKNVWSGDSERMLFQGGSTKLFKVINDYQHVHTSEWFYWGLDKDPKTEIKFSDGTVGPCERDWTYMHYRHRKTKSLDDVLNRRYEDTYLGSKKWRYRDLEKCYAIYTDFKNCQEDSKRFLSHFDPGRQVRISNCFDADTWKKYNDKARNDNRFYPTVKNVVDSILCDYHWRLNEFLNNETGLKNFAREAVACYDNMIRLLEDEQDEFERLVFNGAASTSGGGDNIWQFGIDERDVQKDPKKALMNMEEAIKRKREAAMGLLYTISGEIKYLRHPKRSDKASTIHEYVDTYLPKTHDDSYDTGTAWRQPLVVEWVKNVVEVLKEFPDLSWEDHMAKVRQKYKDTMLTGKDGRKFSMQEDVGRMLQDTSWDMSITMKGFLDVINGLYGHELNYGLTLGLSAAGAAKKRDPKNIPVKPSDWPPKPAPPPAPSRGFGSDPDYLGDGWRLEGSGERRGWKSMTNEGWKP